MNLGVTYILGWMVAIMVGLIIVFHSLRKAKLIQLNKQEVKTNGNN